MIIFYPANSINWKSGIIILKALNPMKLYNIMKLGMHPKYFIDGNVRINAKREILWVVVLMITLEGSNKLRYRNNMLM